MSTETVRLVVARDSDRDIRIRDLLVTIDDQPERNLLFGQSVDLELPPGEHRITVSNRLFRARNTFQAKAGEVVEFQAANVQKPGLLNAISFVSGGVMYRPILMRI